MSPEERQALREKHKPGGRKNNICNMCGQWNEEHYEYWAVYYPCDVIKVLDATENLKPNDLKTEVECNHYGVDSGGTDYYGTSNPPQESDWNFTYCPKCGEKL